VAGPARTQPDGIVHAAKSGWSRRARLVYKGARNLPSTQQGVSQPVGLVEDGQTVDIVPLEDLTAVISTVPFAVLQVPRVLDPHGEVLADTTCVQILIG